MNDRTRAMRDQLLDRGHHHFRQPADPDGDLAFAAGVACGKVPAVLRASARLAYVLDRERPVICLLYTSDAADE